MADPLNWYDHDADNPAWIKALADARRLALREGYCFHHVQAIIVSNDQYAEAALGMLQIVHAMVAPPNVIDPAFLREM